GRLVDDLLDFSAIESGIMRLQWDWCDIRLVVQAAIACLPPASAASVALTCDASLPVVWADHDRMEQVFVNLLNNASRHSPPGTPVHVTADHGMSEVVITVRDDGIGLPPELVAAPFEAARRRITARATVAPAAATARAPAPASACPSPRGSCRPTAAGSS